MSKAIYIEAVNEIDLTTLKTERHSVFLAGGITNCPDWQQEVVKGLSDLPIIIFNPRRANFPINDPNAALEQITWEYNKLNRCDLICYWFAKETVQPIVLFELGRFVHSLKPIIIGIHPEYPRIQDVKIQTRLARPAFSSFVYSLDEYIKQIRHSLKYHLGHKKGTIK